MRTVPVLDVMDGRVVRAVGGRRDGYRPVKGRLTDSTDPVEVARAMAAATGAADLYVADLDAIRGHPILSSNWDAIREVARLGPRVWLDYGHRQDFDEAEALGAKVGGLVLGTETMVGPGTLFHVVAMNAAIPVMLSVDLRDGGPCWGGPEWGPWTKGELTEVVSLAVAAGVTRVLLLDVAAVGEAAGPVTAPLCRRIRAAFPNLELWTGGGVRNRDDLRRLEDAGADAALVASALHDGTIG